MKKLFFLSLILTIALSQTLSFAGWSSDNVWENPLTLGDPSYDGTNYFGLKIRTLGNITAINGTRIIGVHYESNPYTTTRIYASDGLTLLYSNDSGNGNWANFSNANLNASTNYSIVGVPSGNRIYNDGTAFPYASTDFDIIGGCGGTLPTACYGGSSYISFEFDKIISQTYMPTSNNYTEPINITYPSLTTEVCLDNQTLNKTKATYNLTGLSFLEIEYVNCPYGCDNTSFNCNLTPLETGFYSFLIILGIVIFILFFDRYILRGRR